MSIATFRGGVHPYEGKDLSKDLPIKTVQPKKELVFPMGQHIGAPATPIVAKGDKVLVWSEDWRGKRIHFCEYLQFCFGNGKGSGAKNAPQWFSGNLCCHRK